MNIDITKMSLVELKALVYDQLITIENCHKNVQAINVQIEKFQQSKPTIIPEVKEG